MTNKKTKKAPASGAKRPAAVSAASAQPRSDAAPPEGAGVNVEEAIAKAQRGRVNVTPTKAVELDTENAQAMNNLGIIQYEKRNFKKAVEYYQRALAINPRMPEALNNLGNASRTIGDMEGALNAYQEALTQRAVYPEVYNNL